MKNKYLLIIVLLLISLFAGCETVNNDEEILESFILEFKENYNMEPSDETYELLDKVTYKEKEIILEWSFSEEILDENNKVIHTDERKVSEVTLTAKLDNKSKSVVLGTIISKSLKELADEETLEFLKDFLDKFTFEQTSDYEIITPDFYEYNNKKIALEWNFSCEIIDSNNQIIHKEEEYEATIKLVAKLDGVSLEKEIGKVKSISLSEMEKYKAIEEKVIDKFKETFVFKQTNDEKLDFVSEVKIDEYTVSLTWEYNKAYLKSDGTIKHGKETVEVEVYVLAKCGSYSERISLGKVICKSSSVLVEEAISSIKLPKETNEDITLPTRINGVDIDWYSDFEDVLSNSGKCFYVSKDTVVTISAFFSCNDSDKDVEYSIVIKPYPNMKRLELAIEEIEIPYTVSSDIELKEDYSYDTKAIWSSNRSEVISEKGIVKLGNESVSVILKVKLYIGLSFPIFSKLFKIKQIPLFIF